MIENDSLFWPKILKFTIFSKTFILWILTLKMVGKGKEGAHIIPKNHLSLCLAVLNRQFDLEVSKNVDFSKNDGLIWPNLTQQVHRWDRKWPKIWFSAKKVCKVWLNWYLRGICLILERILFQIMQLKYLSWWLVMFFLNAIF